MPKELNFLLKQGTFGGFHLKSHFSQAVEDLSQPLEKLLGVRAYMIMSSR